MKKMSLVFLLILFCGYVSAAVTTEQLIDPEYMINAGYSESTAEYIFAQKNRVDSKPCEPLYYKENNNKFMKFVKFFISYLDGTVDSSDYLHHDIQTSPSYKDF